LGLLAVLARAALTQAQIAGHVGAMIAFGIQNTNDDPRLMQAGTRVEDVKIADILTWAPVYRLESTNGTLADRTEAMQAFYRFVFKQSLKLDPVNGSANDIHWYRKHWLLDYVGKAESDAVEP
jgi:hypothetical protein